MASTLKAECKALASIINFLEWPFLFGECKDDCKGKQEKINQNTDPVVHGVVTVTLK